MAGGVMQLVAVGAQNQFITGAPEMSFFKQVYKRHTNFSMESVRQTFLTKPTLDNSRGTFTCRINRVADLLKDVYFSFQLPNVYSTDKFRFRWIENVSQYIIYNCSVRIDTQLIDQLWGEWMDVWNELTLTTDQRESYNKMTGNVEEFTDPKSLTPYVVIDNNNITYSYYPEGYGTPSIRGRRFFVPMPFWFTKNPGLALPLIALQYQNIDITFEIRDQEELYQIYDTDSGLYVSPSEYRSIHPTQSEVPYNQDINTIEGTPLQGYPIEDVALRRFLVPLGTSYAARLNSVDIDAYLECNFIFLDESERRAMAMDSHDYLVERVFRTENGGILTNNTIDLTLMNPVKEVIFLMRRSDMNKYNDWSNFTNSLTRLNNNHILKTAKMLWNGMDRFEEKPPEYFNYIQPYQHHTRAPKDGVYVYSFALYPEKTQPSGSFNASMVNKIQLYVTANSPLGAYDYDIVIYSFYYNVFRVMSGSGGMVFAN